MTGAAHYTGRAGRMPRIFISSYLIILMACVGVMWPALPASPPVLAAPVGGASRNPPSMLPYAYAVVSSANSYDIVLSDGSSKERHVATVRVSSVFFSDVTARLSADGSVIAFRVSGDRSGGSSLYVVAVAGGKYQRIASSPDSAEGIGAYAWSPAGNTLAFVRAAPALDPDAMDEAYGTIYIFSVGFQAVRLQGSTGNDRLLGFSGDGLGVLAARRETVAGAVLEHLVYIPISGGEGVVLLRSTPRLSYSHFALWSQPGTASKIAALAEGSFPVGDSGGEGVSLSRPSAMGLVVSDLAGTWPMLLRRDAGADSQLWWAHNGNGLLVVGNPADGTWAVDMDGERRVVNASLSDHTVLGWSVDGALLVLQDASGTRLRTLDYGSGEVVADRHVGLTPSGARPSVQLAVPYIHQVNDLAVHGDGNWACGPTSVAMVLAYYGKLQPWRSYSAMTTGNPLPEAVTGADFAPYITTQYTYNGHTYSAEAQDPAGNWLAGLYGTICPTGLASWPAIVSVLDWHGLSSRWVAATWDGVVGALNRGHPVLLGNMLTPEGHILVVVGYTPDGNLVVNDPYGNRFAPGYGSNDGRGLLYPWKLVTPRRALEVIGVYPPPTATATPAVSSTPSPPPTPTVTLTPTPTPITPLSPIPGPASPTATSSVAGPDSTPGLTPTPTAQPDHEPAPTGIVPDEYTPTYTPTHIPTPVPTLPPAVVPTLTPGTDGSK